MKMRAVDFTLLVLLLVSLAVHPGFPPVLQAQTDPFFNGKTIRIIGGTGGFYESWARIIARHMGKHIRGNPNIIVQPMLGAGSLIAANYVYGVAKPDGLTVGMFLNTIYLDQLVGRKEVQFSRKIRLDRLTCWRSHDAVYARGYLLQVDCRHHPSQGAA